MNFVFPDTKEFKFVATLSRGPGGQHVNKVQSAAQLFWDFESSPVLSEEHKVRIRTKLSSNINKEGIFYLRSDEFRDLERNKARCIEKLEELLKIAFHTPKKRKKTKPTKASQIKRVESKKKHGWIKKQRKKPDYD